MGGLSCIFQLYAEANNERLSGDLYNPDKDSEILYLDVNSMYPAVMQQPLPVDSGSQHALPEDREERLRWRDVTCSSWTTTSHQNGTMMWIERRPRR